MFDLTKDWHELPSRDVLMRKRTVRTMGTPPPPEVQERWDIPEKLVLTAAVSGRIVSDRGTNRPQSFPLDLDSFEKAAVEVIEAGACGVHVDFGGIAGISEGGYTMEQAYDKVVGGINAATTTDWVCDANVLRGETFHENMYPVTAGLAETCPMAPNFPVDWMQSLTKAVVEHDRRLFIVIHSTAEVELAERYIVSTGLLPQPICWIVLIGYPYDDATDRLGTYLKHPKAMMTELIQIVDRIHEVEKNSFIQVCAAGRAGHYLATAAMMMGLHVRVGTEDTAYRFPHRDDLLDGNLEMVERARNTAESLGRQLATAAEYREMIGLPPKP
jgi:3-keto-5-aminohexanoate cleavage enzyme